MGRNDEDFLREFGARLARLRQARGLSQNDLARMLPGGPDSSQVSRWERGRTFPSHRNRRALAKALGVPEQRLFYDPPA